MNQLIVTEDGSHSLYNKELNETYHSFHGALQESQHVFIDAGLNFLKEKFKINILEIGLGTGLNALLSCLWALDNNKEVNYTSLEAFPLEPALIKELNYAEIISHKKAKEYFTQMHHVDWNTNQAIHHNFKLRKIDEKLETYELEKSRYDIVYYDAFAPSKQPEMWSIDILRKVVESMGTKSTFVTYCAQGQLKRNLNELGLVIETLPGPPGKKEMVRGVKE